MLCEVYSQKGVGIFLYFSRNNCLQIMLHLFINHQFSHCFLAYTHFRHIMWGREKTLPPRRTPENERTQWDGMVFRKASHFDRHCICASH